MGKLTLSGQAYLLFYDSTNGMNATCATSIRCMFQANPGHATSFLPRKATFPCIVQKWTSTYSRVVHDSSLHPCFSLLFYKSLTHSLCLAHTSPISDQMHRGNIIQHFPLHFLTGPTSPRSTTDPLLRSLRHSTSTNNLSPIN